MTNQTLTLTEQEIVKAIQEQKGKKNALTDLLFSKFEEANEKGISISDNYFASRFQILNEEREVFYFNSLKSLFSLCGYSVSWTGRENVGDNDSGKMIMEKDDFTFKMPVHMTIHDDKPYLLVDASSATIQSSSSACDTISEATDEEYTFRFTLSATAKNKADALQYVINDLQTALSQGTLECKLVRNNHFIVVKQEQN